MTDRSYLFVPADRPERFAKALASGAHAVIVDLEDAVQPLQKDRAREQLDTWLETSATAVYVRINAAGTSWHEADLALLRHPAVRGVMLPKACDLQALAAVAARLGAEQRILPLIETVSGWFAVEAIARAPGVERLAFGSLDFMSDAGIHADGPELDPVRTRLVLVSRWVGLPAPIDGVTTALLDAERVEQDARRARRFGLGAKLCVHPAQVAAVHAGFRPAAEEVAWAQRVIDAVENGPRGAVSVDGKLVDHPVEARARALLRDAGAAR